MAKIKLLGSPKYCGTIVEDNDPSIIKLSDGWYARRDPFLVVIDGKHYRRNSPLVVELDPNAYGGDAMALKESTVEYRGLFYHKKDCFQDWFMDLPNSTVASVQYLPGHILSFPSISVINEDGTHQSFRIPAMNSVRLERFFKRSITGKFIAADSKSTLKALSRRDTSYGLQVIEKVFHKSELDYLLESKVIFEFGKEYWDSNSVVCSKDLSGRSLRAIALRHEFNQMTDIEKDKLLSEYCHAVERFVIQEGRSSLEKITFGRVEKSLIDKTIKLDDESNAKYSELFRVPSTIDIDRILKEYAKTSEPRLIAGPIIKDNYFDQPIPIYCNSLGKNEGGNYLFHESSSRNLDISGGKSLTGLCGYTFGVEIETSVGVLPKVFIERLGLKAVGDRSIGAMEYVTKPLYGNKGIKLLNEAVEKLSLFTGVDKRCGIHVHIGGSRVDESPVFNRDFSVKAVKLACMIEDEMFEIVPPDRTKGKNREGLAYCGRFASEFKDISKDNWREKLGMFVFGRPYDDETNKKTKLNRWTPTRYKWLNLVNCNSNNGGRSDAGTNTKFETIEFRLWDGSLVWEDVYSFVLLSMAFTKFVENKGRLIEKYDSITISEVVSLSLRGPQKDFLLEWIKERKNKVKLLKK